MIMINNSYNFLDLLIQAIITDNGRVINNANSTAILFIIIGIYVAPIFIGEDLGLLIAKFENEIINNSKNMSKKEFDFTFINFFLLFFTILVYASLELSFGIRIFLITTIIFLISTILFYLLRSYEYNKDNKKQKELNNKKQKELDSKNYEILDKYKI